MSATLSDQARYLSVVPVPLSLADAPQSTELGQGLDMLVISLFADESAPSLCLQGCASTGSERCLGH